MIKLSELQQHTKGFHLLYVEDNKESREEMSGFFEDLFKDVTVAIDGVDALEKYKNNKFDLIITDINMPNMDGLTMSRKIKEIDDDTPILVISAYQDIDYLLQGIKVGIDGYIVKPLEINQFSQLLLKISTHISRKKEIQKQKIVQKKLYEKIEAKSKHIKESINYASFIQGALMPPKRLMSSYFKDHFVIWTPKDTVGGDIWLFDTLRHEDECLLFVIDCTGHGVPGAFVTMIVKAVEREVISLIKANKDLDISPAWIMGYFNKAIKQLLNQEDKSSLSNVGFDGGIIYYNRRTQLLKFCGALTSLFYIDENNQFNTIKGDRYSVGYKICDMNYEYKETILNVTDGMKFYCTTDGYLDQNGGEHDFPFGQKRFCNIIKENYNKKMSKQKDIFLKTITQYETYVPNNERNDDMTVVGFEIGVQSDFSEDTISEILKYEGRITQNVIASCMDNIEYKIKDKRLIGVISTITIEYCQNMMKYAKDDKIDSNEIVSDGKIQVEYINNRYYEITAVNVISISDKEKIEPKLIDILNLDRSDANTKYKQQRSNRKITHNKDEGLGLYKIAEASDKIGYNFIQLNKDKIMFMMKSVVY